ncbi:unnamed protein product [Rotaria socialis]|uniref:Tetraspanin n=2 Tax=Rotaria socialis TaxID=392032 RepID=A0A817T7D9_9BILA|nr:unnamed protein product [Rotaria socialis]CAF3306804.1 unnamed protein product [Rotaria socialis]CAF3696685.1 unnamed protein product [Rotaria socialis]CAF4198965.1 unnamed protein product [Rotaria socialis]CAF4259323.1 unnamed protein product [Rotaria socialis]
MNRRKQRTRSNIKTRTYPVYTISASDLSSDESIIEIKPIKRYQHHRREPFRFNVQESFVAPVVTGNRKHVITQTVPRRRQKSATIQTDEMSNILSTTNKNEKSSKNKSSVCNRRCLRILALILAIFILHISLLLLAFSLNLLLNPNMTKIRSVAIVYSQALPSSSFTGKGPTDTLLVTAIIGIILGCIILIISLLTVICLICIKFRYYVLFYFIGPVLLLILLLILIGFGIFISITGDTELQRLASSTQTTVYYYYNSTSTSLVRDGWDFVQYYFSCCGVKDNNTDWYHAPSTGWKYNSQLPRSCCGYDSNDIGHVGRIFVGRNIPALTGICYYGDIGQPTCYNSIKTNLLITVLVFTFGLAFLVFILAILFLRLLFIYRKMHHRVENSTGQ